MIPVQIGRRCFASHARKGAAQAHARASRLQQPSRPFSGGEASQQNPSSAKPPEDATIKNVALAACLVAFSGGVFMYSIRSVGRSGEARNDDNDDPLAQLKAEAQEARDRGIVPANHRMTPEEIDAMERGAEGGYDDGLDAEAAGAKHRQDK